MKKIIMLAVLGIALVLSACGNSSSGEAARVVQGNIADYTGSTGALEVSLSSDLSSAGTGSMSADGSFRAELSATLSASALEPITFFEGCDAIVISDRNAQFTRVAEINVLGENGEEGFLTLASEAPSENAPASFTAVGRLYVDRDVTVTGTCEEAGAPASLTLDLDLGRGWNVFTLRFEENANPFGSSTYTSGEASDVAWYYTPF